MFTRLLQSTLITLAVYLTMLASPPPIPQSISSTASTASADAALQLGETQQPVDRQ
jgi:hypothetical protein